MESVVGVFDSVRDAGRSVAELRASGIEDARINLLIPGESAVDQPDLAIETEQPGIGKAVGGVVGGAAGAVAGISIAASLMLPGVGIVTAVGMAAGALLTVAGAIGGGAVGGALDQNPDGQLPVDELYVYEDALRKGRTVVIVVTQDDEQRTAVRRILEKAGAESIDAAREQWWVGLDDAAAARYEPAGTTPVGAREEARAFRRGFEMAQLPGTRDKHFEQVSDYLRSRCPEDYAREPFRRGYESGSAYRSRLRGDAAAEHRR